MRSRRRLHAEAAARAALEIKLALKTRAAIAPVIRRKPLPPRQKPGGQATFPTSHSANLEPHGETFYGRTLAARVRPMLLRRRPHLNSRCASGAGRAATPPAEPATSS